MSTNKTPQKKDPPQVVKLDKGLELAKKWVNNMTEPAEDHRLLKYRVDLLELFIGFLRLGLGAKVPLPSKFSPSDDPLERKLHYKLDAGRRNAAKIAEESASAARDYGDNNEDLDSRTKAFEKKRPAAPVTPSLRGKKRKK